MTIKSDEYTCANCKEVFNKGWSNQEALEEKELLFPDHELSKMDLVCEECFEKIMKFNKHPGWVDNG